MKSELRPSTTKPEDLPFSAPPRPGFIKTDENEEAVSALEFLSEIAPRVERDIYNWKWVINTLHNALQAFMVTTLRRTDGSGPMHERKPEKKHTIYRWKGGIVPSFIALQAFMANRFLSRRKLGPSKEGAMPLEERLDGFLDLYRKIKKGVRMHQFVGSKQFDPKGTQETSVYKLNLLRNEFIHFTPKGWWIEASGLPAICLDCLQVIRFLAEESGNILWIDPAHRRRTSAALTTTEDFFRSLKPPQ